jgi:hypothetical protein
MCVPELSAFLGVMATWFLLVLLALWLKVICVLTVDPPGLIYDPNMIGKHDQRHRPSR